MSIPKLTPACPAVGCRRSFASVKFLVDHLHDTHPGLTLTHAQLSDLRLEICLSCKQLFNRLRRHLSAPNATSCKRFYTERENGALSIIPASSSSTALSFLRSLNPVLPSLAPAKSSLAPIIIKGGGKKRSLVFYSKQHEEWLPSLTVI